jgi:hypothetical protein
VIQGVNPGEPSALTTMWTIPGFQLCTVALPVWLTDGGVLPEVTVAGDDNVAPLCDFGLQLKAKCFPVKRGSGKRYIDVSALINQQGTGILQKIQPLENKILERGTELLNSWRSDGFKEEDAAGFYDWVDKLIYMEYDKQFGITKK